MADVKTLSANNVDYAIKDEVARQKITNIGNMSYDEVLTGKTWFNGKPIYRKVINVGQLPAASGQIVMRHEISNLGWFTSISGIAHIGNGKTALPLPYVPTGTEDRIAVYANETNVTIKNGNHAFSSYYGYVILEYTKTTD